ncbi:MAG TPA: hypothetical protein VIL74_13055 [Pyrinomonadaceae bacterium]|jgi:hypothetical protein
MADLLNINGFNSIRSNSLYASAFTFFLLPLAVSLLFCADIKAQEDENIPENLAPPALRIISKEENSQLAGTTDVKNRTRLALDLMEARLKKAEELHTQEFFGDTLTQLGSFQALMDDTLRFLNRNDDGRGKVMGTFKRFEMALRTFMPRLELIRREMPERYEYHVRRLLRTVRDARTKAIEPFFSSTVMPGTEN